MTLKITFTFMHLADDFIQSKDPENSALPLTKKKK